MPTPNPAGYYSLDIPEAIEKEIEGVQFSDLAALTYGISELLVLTVEGDDFEYASRRNSAAFDTWVNNLQVDALINLIRWLSDRMASLYPKEQSNA